MSDLRRDINEVFEKQQGQLGDVVGTASRMLRAATAGRRVNRQAWRSVAGVAVVLVAASAIGISVVIRGLHPKNVVTTHPSPTPIATPAPTPAPTAMSLPLQVPASTPVILFHDPVNFNQIDGITWDGSVEGRLGVYPEAGQGILPNPAGTLWATTHDARNRSGAIVTTLTSNTKAFPGTWADDGQHYCSMVSKSALPPAGGEPATLQVTAVGQGPKDILQVGRMYDQASSSVVACSLAKDTAVVAQGTSIGMATQFWVVQISTGRILWSRSNTGDVRASADGQYIAEISYNQATGNATTTIYGATGAVLGHTAGVVDAFSWDGSLAVVGNFNYGPVSVVRWRDGTVVWSGPIGGGYLGAMPEPGGQRIAVTVSDPQHPQTGGFYPGDIYLVGPDGHAVKLLTNVIT